MLVRFGYVLLLSVGLRMVRDGRASLRSVKVVLVVWLVFVRFDVLLRLGRSGYFSRLISLDLVWLRIVKFGYQYGYFFLGSVGCGHVSLFFYNYLGLVRLAYVLCSVSLC